MSIIRVSLFILLLAVPAYSATGVTMKSDLTYMLGQGVASSNRSWPDSVLYRFLNMAQDLVSGHAGKVQGTEYIAGGTARTTPSTTTFLHLKGMAWLYRNAVAVKPIPVIPYDSLGKLIGRNTKQSMGFDKFFIAEDGGQVVIFPTPNAADSVRISFYGFAVTLDSATECSYSQDWEQVIIMAAAAMCYQHIRNQFWTQYYTSERDKQIAAMRALTTREGQVGAAP